MALQWVEAHRPRRLRDVAGNQPALTALSRWADAWKDGSPKRRAILLVGPPGCGKTSAAHALGAERGWEVVELNASDARSAPMIRRVAGLGALHDTFSATGEYLAARDGRRKLIIVDEADHLYERGGPAASVGGVDYSDRGGKREIVQTVRQTRQPIALIVNDAYALTRGSGGPLTRLVEKVTFHKPPATTVAAALKRVADAEGVSIAPDVVLQIADSCDGDLRSSINDLQALAEGTRHVTSESLAALGGRNRSKNVFDAVRGVLGGRGMDAAIAACMDLDERPEDLLLWVEENLPYEYIEPLERAMGFDALSRADVFLGRARRRQAYRLWGYARQMMTGGVALARRHRGGGYVRYRFPTWLRIMGGSKGGRAVRATTAKKIGHSLHASTRVVLRDSLTDLRSIFLSEPSVAERASLEMGLEWDEIAFVMGPDADEAYVRRVAQHVERRRERTGADEDEGFDEAEGAGSAADDPTPDPDHDDDADDPQPTATTLFDFG